MRKKLRLLVVSLAAFAACGNPSAVAPAAATAPAGPPSPPAARDPVVAAAGDIVCGTDSRGNPCKDRETRQVALGMNPDAVLTLGDLQYETGSYPDFINFYEMSWGSFRSITQPVPGNHEYMTPSARGYFDYWNGLSAFSGPAGDRDKGYYAFNLGDWHIVGLNSECGRIGGCGSSSPMASWLRQDLAANRRACTLAYWHTPLFSSGQNGGTPAMRPVWQILYDAGVDVVLNGHDHSYERFAPQTPAGAADPARGIRQFVVGTGGRNLTPFPTIQPNSELRDSSSFGVLQLRLHPTSYDWQFHAIPGMALADRGVGLCH
ncbi:MAG TPA: metallophosphoesterase [Vicinamibacteria bacterium]